MTYLKRLKQKMSKIFSRLFIMVLKNDLQSQMNVRTRIRNIAYVRLYYTYT